MFNIEQAISEITKIWSGQKYKTDNMGADNGSYVWLDTDNGAFGVFVSPENKCSVWFTDSRGMNQITPKDRVLEPEEVANIAMDRQIDWDLSHKYKNTVEPDVYNGRVVWTGYTQDEELMALYPDYNYGIIFFQANGETIAVINDEEILIESYDGDEMAEIWGRGKARMHPCKLFSMVESALIGILKARVEEMEEIEF